MAVGHEARQPAALGFVGVDGERLVIASARVGHVVGASTERPAVPGIHQIEDERRMHADGGLQTLGRLPGPVADPAHLIARGARRMQGDPPAVAR